MATKIRLKRFGGKHDPHFRIVIADSAKKRDGRAIEEIGYYCPTKADLELEVKAERAQHWLDLGAQPTETVRALLVKAGVIEGEGLEVAEETEEVEVTDEAAEEADVAENAEAADEAEEADVETAEE